MMDVVVVGVGVGKLRLRLILHPIYIRRTCATEAATCLPDIQEIPVHIEVQISGGARAVQAALLRERRHAKQCIQVQVQVEDFQCTKRRLIVGMWKLGREQKSSPEVSKMWSIFDTV
jgi:hypothetical protein